MRALMLTPDEGHLDRRIVQEAGTLTLHGWQVDIHPAVDPVLTYGGRMPEGVRLLLSPREVAPMTKRRRAMRALRRGFGPRIRVIDQAIEAARYRRSDRAGAITAANLDHLLAGDRYDLVLAHDVPVFPLAAHLASEWSAPLICDLHEIFPEQDEHFTTETAREYWRRIERDGITAADGIIAVNGAVADYVAERYAPTVTTVVIHNAMPHAEPAALHGRTIRDHYPIPSDTRVMLFAGSLRPYANLEMVIGGFAEAALDGWVLAILGEGPLREPLEKMIRRRGLEGRVFLGRRAPESELIAVTASADIGLLPYQAVGINHEIATPNKLFEYIQARLPLATSRLPMIEKIVEGSGIGGFIDFSTEWSTAADLRRYVVETLPTVERDALEAAANRWSWEREEPALLEVVNGAMRRERR
jgi:glycosyltransferase involved in cell wall biosynthesis